MLKQRIITALILLPIALCGFFLLEGAGFALFIGLVVTLGAWEWARLAGFAEQLPRVVYAAVVALLLFLMYILPDVAPWVLGAAVLWWALATFLVLTYPRTSGKWSSVACKLVIGLLILLPAWQGLVYIKHMALGNWLIMA
ncbi:phosphatidate cytidylyltransferase, partial [Pseudomonas proteolytica]